MNKIRITHAALVELARMGAPGLSAKVYEEAGAAGPEGNRVPLASHAAGDELHRLARDLMSKHPGMTYRSAFGDALAANPDLRAIYGGTT